MRLLTLSVVLALGACGPLPRAASVSPVAKAQPRMEEAIRAAREAFIRAAQAGDAEAMSKIFAVDVVLITGGNDTIRGRGVIAESLKTARPGAEQATFWFARFPPLQTCDDGAYEHGEFRAEVWNTKGTTDTVHAPFVVRWRRDSLGNAQIQRVAFAEREIARPLGRGECVDRSTLPAMLGRARQRQASSRWSVTVYPFKQPFGGPSSSLKRALTAQGWHDPGYVCPSTSPCFNGATPVSYNRAPVGIIPRLGQVRVRLSTPIAMLLFLTTAPQGSAIGHNDADSSELEIGWSGWSGGAMMSYHHSGFYVQAGPAVELAHWRIDERALPYNASDIYEARYHSTALGVVLGGGYTLPIDGPFYLDLHAEASQYQRTTLHGTPRFQPAQVTNSSYFVGFGFGLTL